MGKDLGTYYVQVELKDGRGFIERWNTGGEYWYSRNKTSPLNAQYILPRYTDENDLIDKIIYMFTEGNYACDCNLNHFLDDAAQLPRREVKCGDEILIKKLTIIRPDESKQVIYED